MNCVARPICLLMLVLSAVAVPAGVARTADPVPPKDKAAPHTKESLQKLYTGYLANLGYKSEVEADGDIKVRIEGKTFYIYVRPDLPTWFSMEHGIMALDKGADTLPVLTAAGKANEITPVAKVILAASNVVAVKVQIRVTKPEDVRDVLPLVIERLVEGRNAYENHLATIKAGK